MSALRIMGWPAVWICLALGSPLAAEDKAAEGKAVENKAAKEPSTLRELIDAVIDDVQIFADAEAKEPARAVVGLRWANNVRGSEDGATVIYVHQGRPLAVACLYPWEGQIVQELGSLSPEPIIARRGGNVIWRPLQAGIKFAEIPEAPAPEPSATQRLRQMKSLAGQFQSTMLGWKAADSDDREELRLLSRPLYRYETGEGQVVDGAVFAFVMGTDPEAALLIEAVKQGDATKWRYAFARRTSGELEGRYRGRVVWKVPRYSNIRDITQPTLAVFAPIPEDLLPAKDKP
jgi:hypothetical protein